MHRWYLAKTKPQKEHILATSLARYDVETFLPRIANPNTPNGRMEPLFPTYLFCKIDSESEMWPAIRWASGLAYFLTDGAQSATMPDSLISYISERVELWNNGALRQPLSPGQRVAVSKGPFANLEGIFRSYVPARQRCQVLLEIMNRSILVEVPEWHLLRPHAPGLLDPAEMRRIA